MVLIGDLELTAGLSGLTFGRFTLPASARVGDFYSPVDPVARFARKAPSELGPALCARATFRAPREPQTCSSPPSSQQHRLLRDGRNGGGLLDVQAHGILGA